MPFDRSIFVGALAAALVLLVALWWLHPEVALQGKVYASSDAQAAAAFQVVGDEALEAGEFPHWNPFVFAGMPSYASLAYNPRTYPLTEPIRFLREALSLPPMTWMLVHVWIAGMGLVFWMRWRGMSWPVAIVAGVALMAMPKLVAWGAYGHGTKVGTFAWMPWALWFTEALLRRGGIGWAAGLAVVLALALLRAHVQIAYYAVMAIGVLVLAHVGPALRDASSRRPALTRTGLVVVAGVLALGVALFLYLPVLEYQEHSVRGAASQGGGATFDYATSWSLSWPEFSSLWWPTAAGYGRGAYVGQMPFTDYPNYVGLPLLLLAAIGVALRRDRTTWALVALVVLTTLLSLGKNFFLYQLFFDLLPGFKKFRVPVMILIVQELAVIALAVQGLEGARRRLREDAAPPAWLGRVGLVVVVASGLVLMLLGTVGSEALRSTMASRWVAMAAAFERPVPPPDAMEAVARLASADALRLGAVLVVGALALATWRRPGIPTVAPVVVVGLLVFVDLWRVDQPMLHPEDHLPQLGVQGNRRVAVPSDPVVRDASALREYTAPVQLKEWLLEQEERPRVFPLGPWANDNRLAAQGIVSLGGYHAAKLAVYEQVRDRLFDPQRPEFSLANLFAARWVLTQRPLSEQALQAVGQLGSDLGDQPALVSPEGSVYENHSALPRAWMVGAFELEMPGEDTTDREPGLSVLSRVLSPSFDPRAEVILSGAPEPRPRPGGASGSVEVFDEGYNEVALRVDTPEPGVLVVSDVWYPSWSVRIDGEPARLLRANHAQRAVALPAGTHEVRFEYDASSYATGRVLSGISTTLIALGLLWAAGQRWRASRSPGTAVGATTAGSSPAKG